MDDRAILEVNLVRVAIDALQGMQSALLRLENISSVFCTHSADRTSNKISSLWIRCSSTHALGAILKSIMHTGTLVFVLHKFVDHFTNLNCRKFSDITVENSDKRQPPYSLVNHAFSVAVDKVLKGYTCALDTVYASVCFRRSLLKSDELLMSRNSKSYLTTIEQHELTFLDVYLHTRDLCTQIEALGYLCDFHDVAACCPFLHDEVPSEMNLKFINFHKGADLLSYLYSQLRDSDPAHSGMLKFLFLRSWEPYSGLIRSWIFKAEVVDPFDEFLIHDSERAETEHSGKFAKIRTSNAVPDFLTDAMFLIIRTGQQLQVLKQLLLACKIGVSGSHQDLLLCWSKYADDFGHLENQISFCRSHVEASTIARKDFFGTILEKANVLCSNLTQLDEQILNFLATDYAESSDENCFPAASADKCIEISAPEISADLDGLETSDQSECSTYSDSDNPPNVENWVPCLNVSILDDRSSLSSYAFLCRSDYDNRQIKPASSPEDARKFCIDAVDPKNLDVSSAPPHSTADQKKIPLLSNPELKNLTGYLNSSNITSCDSYKFYGNLKSRRSNNGSEALYPRNRLFGDMSDLSEKNFWDACLSELPPKITDYGDILSMNPMLRRSYRESALKSASKRVLPCFDFSVVEDPQRAFCDRKLISSEPDLNATTMAVHYTHDVHATALSSDTSQPNETNESNCQGDIANIEIGSSVLESVKCDQFKRGGSSWERLLCTHIFGNKPNTKSYNQSTSEMSDIPLDTVIEKCILQEIYLQYCCVSKLSLKMLENGFDLRGHFLALRRYFFMEVADWADLFVASLRRHKWHEVGSENMLSVLQRLLRSAIQKSSCERDPKKELLFININEGVVEPILYPIGICSFDFFCLGYKVNWPVNFVLTPSALEIYGKIFSFLLKVKVSALALSDVWKLLKEKKRERKHIFGKQLQHFNLLIQTRHQFNHFLTSLQQYLQSQLSHVSWCHFVDSLQLKVKDMMDLESAHSAYLTDSLNKCFLSEGTGSVRTVIGSILQCFVEFRQCVGDFTHQVPENAVSRVVGLRSKFDASMNELRACRTYPDSGLRCLWECLSNNEFYLPS